MILEAAPLQVRPGQAEAFETAFREAQSIISSMPGYRSHELQRCLEREDHYLLLVRWDSVAAHEEGFRKSPQYQRWKQLLHHFYDPFPTVNHYRQVAGEPAAELEAIAGARACLDGFTASFNGRDLRGMDRHLHFPHVILSGSKVTIWEAPGRLAPDFFEDLAATGWTRSTYEARDPLVVTRDKVHLRVEYSRRGRDGGCCLITRTCGS